MKLSIAAAVVTFAASVMALPPAAGNSNVKYPVPNSMTVKQASDKCGDKAQVSCCNKATYSGDLTKAQSGILAGALNDILGGSGASEGAGLFDQCAGISVVGLLNDQCKQNVACCQNSPSSADGNLIGLALPCVALGSLL
ncbi:hydrophobin [Aspergillus unguis]